MKLLKIGVGVVLILQCFSCGLRLRGYGSGYKVNYDNLYLDCNNNNMEVCSLLKSTIINQHLATVNDNRANANYILGLSGVQAIKNPVSLNQFGRISAYQLTYNVTLQVFNKNGKLVLNDKLISVSRVINYNDSLLLSFQAQEQSSWEDIHQSVVDIILHNLTRIK